MEIVHKIFEIIGFLSVCAFLGLVCIGVIHRDELVTMEDEDIDDEV